MAKRIIKVASFSETDRGGAGLSALKLHNALLIHHDVESRLFVNRKSSDCEGVFEIPTKQGQEGNEFRVGQYRNKDQTIPMTTGLSVKSVQALEEAWRNADVILLRWASVIVPDWVIGLWSHRKKPIVWCLSDMAPLTGGCHYSMGCTKYETGCKDCYMAPAGMRFYPAQTFERRRRLWGGLTIVSPSKWLADIASYSGVTKAQKIEIIQTGVELDIFCPQDRTISRRKTGVPRDKRVIFFGAGSLSDIRKGGKYLAELVPILNDKLGWRGKYAVIAPGLNPEMLNYLDCEVHMTGHVDDRHELATIYSSADVTVLPYVEDNLPNICLESLACGVPVCAFSIGGMQDVIAHGVNGFLSKPFDVWDLANHVSRTLHAPFDAGEVRRRAESELDVSFQAANYIRLFKELVNG